MVGRRIDLAALQPVTSEKLRQTYIEKGEAGHTHAHILTHAHTCTHLHTQTHKHTIVSLLHFGCDMCND